LKATNGWDKEGYGRQGEDKFGFSAMPGGFGFNDGGFGNIYCGLWWSSADNGPTSCVWGMSSYDDNAKDDCSYDIADKYNLFSVRCIQN